MNQSLSKTEMCVLYLSKNKSSSSNFHFPVNNFPRTLDFRTGVGVAEGGNAKAAYSGFLKADRYSYSNMFLNGVVNA